MNNKQEQIRQYLDQTFTFLNSNNRRIITEKRREQAYNAFLNSSKSEEDIKKEIDTIRDRLLKEYEELQKKIGEMVQKEESRYTEQEHQALEQRNPNKPIDIKKINISEMNYDELEKMFFHYTWKHNFYSINETGLQAGIGKNSEGIDKKPSIFFSSGVEAALQTWDVWLKWRLNRMNNPLWQGKTEEEIKQIHEIFNSGQATHKQYFEYKKWEDEYLSGAYKDNPEILQELFEYQFEELSHSIYLSFDLKEGQDYVLDQVDHKKENNLPNKDNPHSKSYAFFRVMYGDYTDYSSTVMDKWNMQTIPGREITIPASKIVQLTTRDGKEDVWSILNEFYKMYKANVPKEQQTKFDLLDSFMSYTRKKQEEKPKEKRQAESVSNPQEKDEVIVKWIEDPQMQPHHYNQQQDNSYNPLQPSSVYNPDVMMNPNNNGFGQMGQPMGGPMNSDGRER